jgi:rhamnose transport system permease protein
MSARLPALAGVLIRSREFILLATLVALFALFSARVEGFHNWANIFEISRFWVVTGMVAVPMTFIIATAGIDLSVGSMVALCGVIFGMLFADAGWPIWAAASAAVGVGAVLGLFNGGVSSYIGVPPLVVTLATMALYRGLAMGITKARSVSNFPEGFMWIGQGDVMKLAGEGPRATYLPAPLLALAAVVLIGWLLMRRTWVGRFTEAIGENETAARFAAVDVRFVKMMLYTAAGVVCGIAALFNTALFATAKADVAYGLELEAIACVVIGGTRISGGYGSVLGTLLGLLIIGILRHGLQMMNVKFHIVVIIVGLLLIVTAVLNEWVARRAGGNA